MKIIKVSLLFTLVMIQSTSEAQTHKSKNLSLAGHVDYLTLYQGHVPDTTSNDTSPIIADVAS